MSADTLEAGNEKPPTQQQVEAAAVERPSILDDVRGSFIELGVHPESLKIFERMVIREAESRRYYTTT